MPHLAVAWLALQVAFGVPEATADPRGAIGIIADTRYGWVPLAVGAVGLTAFAIWQLTAAAVGFTRAAAVAVVGLLAGTAALFADPRRAGGLDAALRALAGTWLGTSMLLVVAVGFAAYGVFCLVDAATPARVSGPIQLSTAFYGFPYPLREAAMDGDPAARSPFLIMPVTSTREPYTSRSATRHRRR